MSEIKLQLAIRKTVSGLKLQIRQQYSYNISYSSNALGYSLACASAPEINPLVFYLRGRSSNTHLRWTPIAKSRLNNVVAILSEYAAFNGWAISADFSMKETLITITDNQDLYSFRGSIHINRTIEGINNMLISDESELLSKTVCENCNKESDTCKRIVNVSYYITLCETCQTTMVKCDCCKMLVNKTDNFTNSLGNVRKVCNRCMRTATCEKCSFKELSTDVKNTLDIDENGNNTAARLCLKCSKGTKRCGHCFYSYGTHLPNCPCRLPTDFKQLGIRPYNADVTEILQRDRDCEFGLEIEVGVRCKDRLKYGEVYSHTMKLLGNNAIAVYDRSIDEIDTTRHIPNVFRGFEIVTRPMNRENVVDFINNISEKRHESLRSWDVETTGVHIHVARMKSVMSKDGRVKQIPNITKFQIGKLLVFINNPLNRQFIKHIARRYNTTYARLREKKITDHKDMSRECHYDALNTNKTHTIEFRIFRGSLAKDTLMSYLQFVESSIEFVKCTPAVEFINNTSISNLTFSRYIDWLGTTDKSKYRDLKARVATYGKRGQLSVGGEA